MTAEYALGLNHWAADWARAAQERIAALSRPAAPPPDPAAVAPSRYFIER
jgi:hypothetical protein